MFKVCQVRLLKMDITNCQSQKLLSMEGRQGKFYLDGFAPHEFLKLTNLISNHGGIVISPDHETIILSKLGEPSDAENFPRFHVNWLHDSIRETKLQDIGKYLLPNPQQNEPIRTSPSTLASARTEALKKKKVMSPKTSSPKARVPDQKFTSFTASSPKFSRSMHDDNCTGIFSERTSKPGIKGFNRSASSLEQSEQFDVEDNEVLSHVRKGNRSKGNKSMNGPRATVPQQSPKEKKAKNKRKERMENVEKKKRAYSTGPGSGSGENQEKKKRKKKVCINSSHSSFEQAVEDSSLEGKESPPNGFSSFGESGGDSSADIADHSANEVMGKPIVEVLLNANFSDTDGNCGSDVNDGCDPIGEVDSPKVKGYSPRERKSDKTNKPLKPRMIYSYEENTRILQYLADKNLLTQTSSSWVWEKMARSEEFQDPPRNPSALHQHFNRVIFPNYHKYTSDPNIIAILAKKEKRKLKNIIGYFNSEREETVSDSSNLSL